MEKTAKGSIMYEILRAKFSDPALVQMLKNTGKPSENWLGKILMGIRDELNAT